MNGEIATAIFEQLKRHEGMRLKPYRCTAGKLTIGVGRNLDDCGISEEEALTLLENDIDRCESELIEHIPDIYNEVSDARKVVLLNMCFNLGIGGLLGFHHTLALLRNGCYQNAADNMLKSLWAKQVGARAKELSEIMRTGKIQ